MARVSTVTSLRGSAGGASADIKPKQESHLVTKAYAEAGIDTVEAATAVGALVGVLSGIQLSREKRSVLPSGHYANVLRLGSNLGLAVSTDGVGSKVVIAEMARRFDRIGIDCIAMNVN